MKNYVNFVVHNDVLFFKDGDQLRLCIPLVDRKTVWSKLHDELGHLGQAKMLELIKQRFFIGLNCAAMSKLG